MKKILFYFLTAFLVVLSSCSSVDEDNKAYMNNKTYMKLEQQTVVLPKTIKISNSDNSSEILETISYDGNKIVSKTSKNERTDYTYEGDFIVKEVKYNTQSGSDVKKEEYTYSYENSKLTSSKYTKDYTAEYPNGNHEETNVYTYETNGTVIIKSYFIDYKFFKIEGFGNTALLQWTDVLTFENRNLVKKMSYLAHHPMIVYAETDTTEYLYEYDTNNDPFKNILGFDLLLKNVFSNNIVKKTMSSVLWNGNYLNTTTIKTEYICNEEGYPIKVLNDHLYPYKTVEYTY
ncbi:hypothetical protein [Flavobacterium soyae]|uniref:hypothetical protein n=1 Tax=Flavobacterium soyae TaxID=2903098 RepID=UPI001E4F6916|nr:hypothetical protein [Flavobacterium soyae]MCD9577261.1 hypothetical protein [Flavobacterium soyae]